MVQENLFFLAEQILASVFIIAGLSFVIQYKLWVQFIKFLFSQNEDLLKKLYLVCGVIGLPFGLFLVLVHNDWECTPAIIVTIIGWITLIKSFVLSVFPQLIFKIHFLYKKSESFLKKYIIIVGILYILLGALVWSNFFYL